jgi:uncharacterized protein
MVQSAQKGVLRSILRKAVQLGALPGDHHFYITFRTRMPGVRMPDYLKDKFTEEMTIVIQHQYWDLEVTDETFSVVLKFGGQTERLLVPFAAVSRFVDPSINFGMMFDEALAASPAPDSPDDDGERSPGTVVSLDAFRRK